ncbi:hypothetical protein LINPERPRIM_LOCUS1163, partial [Linum perenne]
TATATAAATATTFSALPNNVDVPTLSDLPVEADVDTSSLSSSSLIPASFFPPNSSAAFGNLGRQEFKEEKLSFDVWDLGVESLNGTTTIFASVKIPAGADKWLLRVRNDGGTELLMDEVEGVKFKLTGAITISEDGFMYFHSGY